MSRPNRTPLQHFLRKHDNFCTVNLGSGDGHCSCGRDRAVGEYSQLRRQIRRQLHNQSELLKQHEDDTRQMAQMLLSRLDCAHLINRLARVVLDVKGASDNDRYEAEQAIDLVMPLLAQDIV